MFFVSEEFLRKMEAGEEPMSTVAGEGGAPGEELFPEEKYTGAPKKSARGPASRRE